MQSSRNALADVLDMLAKRGARLADGPVTAETLPRYVEALLAHAEQQERELSLLRPLVSIYTKR